MTINGGREARWGGIQPAVSTAQRLGRRLVAITAAAVVLGGAGVTTAELTANAASDRVTATTAVNVRSGPGTTYDILGGLYPGLTVTVRGTAKNGWTPVYYNGRAAWISSEYLKKVGSGTSAPIATTAKATLRAVSDLNIRTGPGTSYGIVTAVSADTLLAPTGTTKSGWTQIVFGGQYRWVSSTYVTSATGGATPKSAGTAIASVALDVRSVPSDSYVKLGEIPAGGSVTLTGGAMNGRTGIVWGHGVAWVTTKYLTTKSSTPKSTSSTKTTTKTETATKSTTPKKETLPQTKGTRYATTALMRRSNPTADFTNYGDVPTGTALKITGVVKNGRAEVVYNNQVVWVTAQYLATSKPSTKPASSSTSANAGAAVVAFARAALGIPYSYGGGSLTSPSYGIAQGSGTYGYDCSGLARAAVYVGSNHKVILPRTTWDQVTRGIGVSTANRKPGDLIFFDFQGGQGWSHVGIYIGNGYMIEAPHTGANVRIEPVSSGYYASVKQTTRRVV